MAAATQCCLVLRKWNLLVIYSKYRAYSMAIVKQSKYCLNLKFLFLSICFIFLLINCNKS